MADFNVNLSQSQGAGTAPVGGYSTYQPAPGMHRIVGDAVNIFAGAMAQRREAEAQASEQAILGGFVRQMTDLNDAMAQGTISPSAAATKARARTSEYMSQYPQYVEQFASISAQLKNETELSEAFNEEEFRNSLRRQALKDAVTNGAVIPTNASEEYLDMVLETHQAMVAEQTLLQRQITVMTERRAQEGADRSKEEYYAKRDVERTLTSIMTVKGTEASSFVNEIATLRQNGTPPEELEMSVNEYFNNINMAIAQIATFNPTSAGPARAAFDEMKETALRYASGEIEQEVLTRQLDVFQTKLHMVGLQNPEVQAMAAVGKFLENMPAATLQSNTALTDLMKASNATGGLLPIFESQERSSDFFRSLRERAAEARKGGYSDPEGAVEQLNTATESALRAIGNTSPEDLTPEMLKDAAKYIASDEFRYLAFDEEGRIDSSLAANARQTIDYVFTNNVKRAVTEKLSEPYMNGTIGDQLNITFTGGGVQFEPHTPQERIPVDPTARRTFLRRIQSSKESVNLLLKMGAHLENRTDYGEYWLENRHTIMPSYFPSPARIEAAKSNGYEWIDGKPWTRADAWREIRND